MMATEITVVMRFDALPPEPDALQASLEDEFLCVVVEMEAEEV
jgi:hypothetical protein